MSRVLEGIRVIEVSHYAYVPSAAAVLADWGADVIKIEHPDHGDPMRGVTIGAIPPGTGGFTFMWELANRGKRSVGLDLRQPEGRELLARLVADADVLLTSMLPAARKAMGVDRDTIRAINDRIIYASGTGQGVRGPDADQGGYDQTSFWYRSGIASALVAPGEMPPELPSAGFGDVTSGLALAGGVAAALFQRERTGTAPVVDGSLLAAGMWANQASITLSGITGQDEFRFPDRLEAINPLVNTYRTSDDRYLGLCIIQSDRHWTDFCAAIGHPELAEDPRYVDQFTRADNRGDLIATLDRIFAEKPLSHWERALEDQGGPWGLIQYSSEARKDPQALENGYVREVDYGAGRSIDLVAAPIQFDGEPHDLEPAPELGANTEEVLLEAGLDWDEILRLKERGAIT